eukprot:TRINITY_DN10287_c0_g1_i1.p1 TRINITY_DN10287_c0_g1~~TRINITY_DN10287_c0_g1_i1.p1  ORF type:complete len:691 (+),score=151.25 TRINITY_DN10287_c0_g1_i1:47-2119(+)
MLTDMHSNRRSHGRKGGPLVVYAHDDPYSAKVGPAEKLQQSISVLDEENRQLAQSIAGISRIRSSGRTISGGRSSRASKPCVSRGQSSIVVSAYPVVASALGSSSSSNALPTCLSPRNCVQPQRIRSHSPGRLFPGVAASYVPSMSTVTVTNVPMYARSMPSSPASSRAPSPVSTSPWQQALLRAPSVCSAVASPTTSRPSSPQTVAMQVWENHSVTPGRIALKSPVPGHPGAQVEVRQSLAVAMQAVTDEASAKAQALETAARRESGFAEVYNEFLESALESMDARNAAAARTRERDEALAMAEDLRVVNARLEQAVAAAQAVQERPQNPSSTCKPYTIETSDSHRAVSAATAQTLRQNFLVERERASTQDAQRAQEVLQERSLQLEEDLKVEVERQRELDRQHEIDLRFEATRLAARDEEKKRRRELLEQRLADLSSVLPDEQRSVQVCDWIPEGLPKDTETRVRQLRQLHEMRKRHHHEQLRHIQLQKQQLQDLQQLQEIKASQQEMATRCEESSCNVQPVMLPEGQPTAAGRITPAPRDSSDKIHRVGAVRKIVFPRFVVPAVVQAPSVQAPARQAQEQNDYFRRGWRFFHEKQVRQGRGDFVDEATTARRRASAAMLLMKEGLPADQKENPHVASIWREALLEGAASKDSKAGHTAPVQGVTPRKPPSGFWSLFGGGDDADGEED